MVIDCSNITTVYVVNLIIHHSYLDSHICIHYAYDQPIGNNIITVPIFP